jgi:transglutaminase-like putative cysteine protease
MGARALADGPMKLEVSHRTTYSYRSPVVQSHHLVHLKPRQLPWQSVLHHSLLIEPAPVSKSEIIDVFGNDACILRLEDEHREFVVHARSTVNIVPQLPITLADSAPWDMVAAAAHQAKPAVYVDALQYLCVSRHAPVSGDLRRLALSSFTARRPVLSGAMALTRHIFEDFTFDGRATDVSTPVAQVLQTRRGVCQDFAHLAIAACRSIGVPARYVSGYLMTRPPPGQTKLKGADASHAWFSVWAPDSGWMDFDPTNGIIPAGEHITVAYGRDYDDISPISGVLLGGGEQTMTVAVDVEPAG